MDTPWQDRAACRDTDPDVFFPPCRHHGQRGDTCRICGGNTSTPVESWTPIAARAICATCPVRRPCLDAAVDRHEQNGIWAGAGGDIMRLLRRARRASPDHRAVPSCTCRYCRAVAAHLAALTVEFAETRRQRPAAVHRNGPAVTHGRASTYARGCRCARCRFRVSVVGVTLHDACVDLPAWWDHHLGATHGYADDQADYDAARDVVRDDVAWRITTTLRQRHTTPAWLADTLDGVLDADHVRQLADGAPEFPLNPRRAAAIADALDITVAELVAPKRRHRAAA